MNSFGTNGQANMTQDGPCVMTTYNLEYNSTLQSDKRHSYPCGAYIRLAIYSLVFMVKYLGIVMHRINNSLLNFSLKPRNSQSYLLFALQQSKKKLSCLVVYYPAKQKGSIFDLSLKLS